MVDASADPLIIIRKTVMHISGEIRGLSGVLSPSMTSHCYNRLIAIRPSINLMQDMQSYVTHYGFVIARELGIYCINYGRVRYSEWPKATVSGNLQQ